MESLFAISFARIKLLATSFRGQFHPIKLNRPGSA